MFGIGRCFGLGGGMFGFGGYGYGGINWILPLTMGIFRIVLLVIAIYFIYKLFSRNNRSYKANPNYSSAMAILNERFAKGEINEEEYKAKKQQLQM